MPHAKRLKSCGNCQMLCLGSGYEAVLETFQRAGVSQAGLPPSKRVDQETLPPPKASAPASTTSPAAAVSSTSKPALPTIVPVRVFRDDLVSFASSESLKICSPLIPAARTLRNLGLLFEVGQKETVGSYQPHCSAAVSILNLSRIALGTPHGPRSCESLSLVGGQQHDYGFL